MLDNEAPIRGESHLDFAANEKPTQGPPGAAEHRLDRYFGANSITDGQVRLPCRLGSLQLLRPDVCFSERVIGHANPSAEPIRSGANVRRLG